MRQLIQELGLSATPDDIRKLRREILRADRDHVVYTIRYSNDFYSLSACRDLLFHVQEQCFTIERIERTLQTIGLRFIGFELHMSDSRYRYLAMNPQDESMTNLAL